MSERLLLLFGLPRSGTTWLGKIFDAHPRTLYRHEPDSVDRIDCLPLLPESLSPEQSGSIREYCRGIAGRRSLKVVGKAPVFPKEYLGSGRVELYRLSTLLSRVAARFGLAVPVYGAPGKVGDDHVLVWKSIESLGRLGVLLSALPEARALHIVRHPCGFVASVERGETRRRFDDNSGASEDYNLLRMLGDTEIGRAWGFSLEDLRSMQPEERLAWRWAVFNDKALQDTESAPALSFAYESLCEAPIGVAQDLMEFCELEWSPQVESFIDSSTTASDSTYYSVFKDPKQAAWSWQRELSEEKIARILRVAERSRTWQLLYGEQHTDECGGNPAVDE